MSVDTNNTELKKALIWRLSQIKEMISGSRRKPKLHRKCFSECRILQPRTKSAVLMKRPKPSAKPNGSKNSVKSRS